MNRKCATHEYEVTTVMTVERAQDHLIKSESQLDSIRFIAMLL